MSGTPLDNDTRPRVAGFIQPGMRNKPPFSVEVPGVQKKDGETIPRRNPMAKDELITIPESGITTTYENLLRSVKKFGNAKAIGTRKLIQEHHEVKKVKKMVDGKEQEVDKKWTYFELGPYEYITFNEHKDFVMNLGSGLAGLGLTKQDKMHVYGATR
jgi:long-chain acyl-CoA synthetase